MAYEPKPDTGALFRNERKQHERQPDYRGNCVVNGVTMDMAAWVKESAKGTKFLSIKFSVPQERDAAPPAGQTHRPIPDTDIPF